MTTKDADCARVHEALEALAEDTLDEALRAHVADCDACRDLRHELREAARLAARAGADYRHPEGFAERVLAAADQRPRTATPSAGGASAGAPVDAPVVRDAERASEERAPLFKKRSNEAVPERSEGDARGRTADAPATGGAAPRGGARGAWWAVAAATAAAAAIPLGMRWQRGGSAGRGVGRDAGVMTVLSATAWSGRVDRVARASAEPRGGLTVRALGRGEFSPLAEGAEVPAGAEVRTDERTRARLALADGTKLVLDRGTTVRLELSGPRVATVSAGAVVADVAHRTREPSARIALPTGLVTVLGTRLAVTASPERSTVRVTRGTVRVASEGGREAEVKTGMEGVLARNAAPTVWPAVDLASSVSWSELGAREDRPATDEPVRGLGELRARRPGQRDERDHAVSLVSHAVKVRVVGNLARTEIEEVFRNDTGSELEGIYRFPLPPEAQVERLALDVRGVMEQGAFVDKQRAAAIWRGVIRNAVRPITHRTEQDDLVWVPGPWRDPALLEWQRGGRFELRIFPIPPRGERRVSIAYTQVIAPGADGLRRYVYPLAHDANGSTRVDRFSVDVQVLGHDGTVGVRPRGYALSSDPSARAGASRMTYAQDGFVPAGDLVLEYALGDREAPVTAWAYAPRATGTSAGGIAAGGDEEGYVAIALRPRLPRWSESRPRDYALVVDTSRSMVGERLARASRLTRAMVAEMDPRDRVTVLACDVTCREIPGGMRFAGAEAVRAVEVFLQGEQPHGATDVVGQVRAAARALGAAVDRDGRIVYLGDGAASAGYRRPDRIAREVAEAMPSSRATLTTVAIGADADTSVLDAMARAAGGVTAPYVPGERVESAALSALEATYGVTLRDPSLTLPEGLTAIAPSRLATVRAGAEVMVLARMRAPRVQGEAILRGTVGGEPFETRVPLEVRASADAGNAFVPRLYAAARIRELEERGGPDAREEIVRLSQRFRVASRYTSLLVLEGDAMYRAFGVDRNLAAEADWTGERLAEATVTEAPVTAIPAVPAPSAGVSPTTVDRLSAAERLAGSAREPVGGLGALDEFMGSDSNAQSTSRAAAPSELAADEDDGDAFGVAAGAAGLVGAASQGPGAATEDVGIVGTIGHGSGGGRAAAASGFAPRRVRISAPTPGAAPAPPPRADDLAPVTEAARSRPIPDPAWQQRPSPRGRWMRRVWERQAEVRDAPREDLSRVAAARTALALTPDARGRYRALYTALSLGGGFVEADEVAQRWSTRDALDPDALVRLAEGAARRGDAANARRILSGILDVRADDRGSLERLAAMHERAGESDRACAMRVSLAEVFATDARAIAGASRCERTLGRAPAAQRWLEELADAGLRSAVERELARNDASAFPIEAARGELVVEARWDEPTDLDLAVVDPRGTRVSWAWGRARGLTVSDARAAGRESLGLASLAQTGDYVIELSRATGNDRAIRGTITVRAMGRSRVFRVAIAPGASTVRVGAVRMSRVERLVEVGG
jgi:hypothetical protein